MQTNTVKMMTGPQDDKTEIISKFWAAREAQAAGPTTVPREQTLMQRMSCAPGPKNGEQVITVKNTDAPTNIH